MNKYIRISSLLAMAMLPSRMKIYIFNRYMGADIHPTARIGVSYIDVRKLKMAKGSSIGHLNVIRGLEILDMGEESVILNQNSITALGLGQTKQFAGEADRLPALILGAYSAIVSKHFLDCNNSITIGHHTTIAGIGSAFFTHAINIEKNRQETAPIVIGDYCMVGAMCCVLKGSKMPNCSVLAANSTFRGQVEQTHTLYSGVPAVFIKQLDPQSAYFHRLTGYVD